MAHPNPFFNPFLDPILEDNSRELLGQYSRNQASRNPGAIEEVEDVELTKFRTSSGPDLGLKAVNDEDVNKQHRQPASYRAALERNPMKSWSGTGVQYTSSLPVYDSGTGVQYTSPLPVYDPGTGVPFTNSLPVYDHGFHNDIGVAHASTSRASLNYERIVDAHAAQVGANQQSTSDEEGHQKDLHDAKLDDTPPYVSDDIAAFEDESNGKFQLCLVAPKWITDCIAYVKYEVRGSSEKAEPIQLRSEETLNTFDFPYNFWFSKNLIQREDHNVELAYHFTVGDMASSGVIMKHVGNVYNQIFGGGAKPESQRVTVSSIKEFQRRRLSFRFDVVNDRGELQRNNLLDVTELMAMLTQMIYVANPSNIVECVREYWRVSTDFKPRGYSSGYRSGYGLCLNEQSLASVVKWAAQVADAYGGSKMPDAPHKETIGLKMFILCLGLFELLEHVPSTDCYSEKLYKAYEVVLSSLHKFTVSGCDYDPPASCKRIFQKGVLELVSCISRFSYNWISGLEILGRYDFHGNFLQRVAKFQINMRDVLKREDAEQAYQNAIRDMVNTNESFGKTKTLRRRTYREALVAAPTFPSFLIASRELQLWMSGATDWNETENLEEEKCAELEDGLHQWFTKAMPDVNSYRPKATFLQQHLELIVAHVQCEAVEDNLVMLPEFLAASFRVRVADMLLEILLKSNWGNGKRSDSNADLVSLVETTKGVVLNYPFTFMLPLLPVENRLLLKLASSETDDLYNLSKLIIRKVGGHYSDENCILGDTEYQTIDVLRPWLLASTKRGMQSQSYSPLLFFRLVDDILNLGVEPSSMLGRCLTQAAVASSQQQSRGLQHFLAEVEKIGQLHESLQMHYKSTVVNMIQRQLQSAPNFAELDQISEQILRNLCTQHGQGLLNPKEKIQVELCEALLEEMAQNAVFVESLSTERAFQTISTSNFTSCLLQIHVPPPSIREHRIYLKVQEACLAFGTLVEKGEATIGTIDNASHTGTWESILKSLGCKKASDALQDAFKELDLYKRRLQVCDILVTLCGYLSSKGYPIPGISTWSTQLTARKEKWRSIPLRILTKSHWPEEAHPSLFECLDSLTVLHQSEIFRCILLNSCRDLFERLKAEGNLLPPLIEIDGGASSSTTPNPSFAMVAGNLVPRSIDKYREEMKPYFEKKNLEKMNMKRLYGLWLTVDAQQVKKEFDLAWQELKLKGTHSSIFHSFFRGKGLDMVELIQAWKAIKAKSKLIDALPKVAQLFQFDDSCEGYLEKMKYLVKECDENCTLKEFSDIHRKEGKALLAMSSPDEEIAFIQLAKSEPLIAFLKDKLNEDFRNLIDAVEEGSDNDFVQQSILSDFIDLHRMFRPVLKSGSPTFEQLRGVMFLKSKASSASDSAFASTLAAKLNVCNENVAHLTRFLSSVANRGLKMKDHMKRILRGGKYHFTVIDTECSLKLTCGDTVIRYAPWEAEAVSREETTMYNLADLQDLRSRARLVLSTHKAQAKRSGTDQADSTDAEAEKDMKLFIEQVDIVEPLVSSISELCASGHFRHAQFEHSASGLQELQALVENVDKERREWYAAVKEARSTNYCLNYFRSMELRLILEVLSDPDCALPKKEICIEVLQWAGIKNSETALQEARENAETLLIENNLPFSLIESLMLIAKSLDPLFQIPPRKASTSGLMKSRSINGRSPSKKNEALVLALVEESQMEHEAVVSLFRTRRLSLRDVPRNVLLCSSFTTWEEIHLLLLRCFQRTQQEVGFFCIAYFEKLSFECQAQFLVVLQEMVHEWEESNHEEFQGASFYGEDCERLGLVCCSKSQALVAVSHHLNVRVCHLGSMNADEVRKQLPAECSNMRVISSEIPGLGKTRNVYSMAPDLVRTLCVSGNTTRNSLVSQLKRLNLQPCSILHLDISSVVNPETFNVLLFELLVLGCLKSDIAGVFHLNTSHIYIELGNTLGNKLAHSLPVCDWFQREHLTWDLESLEVGDDASSDMQVVCIYLHALECKQLENKDLIFSGAAKNVEALPVVQCRGLLGRHFIDYMKEGNTMSFAILEMFVKFLACQLRSLTESIYFKVGMLKFMEAMPNIRSYLVRSLLEVSRDLSLRSVKPWLHEQQQFRGKVTDVTMESRMKGMLRWSDSNHLMIFFHSEGSISFLYRNVNLLPESIIQLVSSQRLRADPQKMPDYATMSSQELWSNLWPILQRSAPSFEPAYVLTADNFLKMALIALRVAAQVPVLIMGETGCGKTSLLKILARYSDVEFSSITLHAGTTVDDIRSFLVEANDEAITGNKKVWAFLDEINACDHLGFLNGVICHHLLDGTSLDPNLVVLAACNPYRIHDIENSQSGFSARELMNPGDVQRYNLAYRVHPLPEAMLDYVWDFGLLSRHDEQAYIEEMVKDRVKSPVKSQVQLFADLLVKSQAFARECHGEASVSLRDASRCISLYKFFEGDLDKRPLDNKGGYFSLIRVRATLLAFSHCYHSRLAIEEQRRNYREMFAGVLKVHEPRFFRGFDEAAFADVLRQEQLDLLNRMDVPDGIARNKAILENVFVTLVCMLNHIPVFVIGKPGSGKTLALQLIYGNLRGSESRDIYFQKLPQMYRFSYQGSESSTSEGILKVFEKAQRCKKDNKGRDVLVVVVLDEVGLAEVSSHNPLKVLHALLEPEEPQQVAVVGISNWSLDAAKMNRAIHLSQPDPSEQDLYDTSIAIIESYKTPQSDLVHQTLRNELRGLAKSYHTYHSCQTKPNFHGLRDFYSLIKSLQVRKSTISWQVDDLVTAVWRNFGGSPDDVERFSQIMKQNLGHEELLQRPPSVMELVRENLQDKDARHLMLITTGDSAVGILEKFQKNVIIIHGSKFKDDCSDDYSYLLLSIIILHMEAGRCILLRGVERLWSSLYDMLNQHYTTVAERRNCRIAIGAYSNPMCYVHDSFRCIVVVDSSQVSRLDPPFLNRFEKQVLTYENILTRNQKEAVQNLKSWCEQLAGLSTDSKKSNNAFKLDDLFAGFHEDTLPSLVLHHQTGRFEDINSTDPSEFALLLDRCKEDLLQTAHVDAMVRASLSVRCKDKVTDLDKWTGLYFGEWQDHQGLREFLETADESLRENGRGLRVVITTRTIIHMPIKKFLGEIDAQIDKLGDVLSERQLQKQIQDFFEGPSNFLILQADAVTDKEHIQHAKLLVEKSSLDFQAQESRPVQIKNIILIIHTHREVESLTGFTFLSGWQQITLDQLQKEETDLRVFLDHSVADLVKAETIPLKDIMVKVFTWSFLCIKYPKSMNSAAYCQEMVQKICEDKELWGCFKTRALEWLVEYADPLWQASVASDRRLLSLSSSLQDAFLHYIEEQLRDPIARLVYALEKSSDLGSYFGMDAKKKEAWRATVLNTELVNIDSVSVPRHPEGYQVECPLNLSMPFVSIYAQHVDSGFQDLYLTQLSKNSSIESKPSSSTRGAVELQKDPFDPATEAMEANKRNGIVDLENHAKSAVLLASRKIEHDIIATMRDKLPEFAVCVDTSSELYLRDFSKIYAPYKCDSRSEVESQAFEWVVRGNLGVGNVTPPNVHILFWEHGDKLKAQALLVASCLTKTSVAEQLAQLKCKGLSSNSFDEYLVAQCYSAVLPQSAMIREDFFQRVEMNQWVRNLEVLVNLASPLDPFGGPTRWATMTSLEVLRDLASMVLPPLSLEKDTLQELVRWFGHHGTNFTPGQLLEAVLSLVPDFQTLRDSLRGHWSRFLNSFFRKVLKGKTTMTNVQTIAVFILKLRDIRSVMKNLIVCVLDAIISHNIAYSVDARCPKYMQFLLNGSYGSGLETPFDGNGHVAFVLLADIIYESIYPPDIGKLLREEHLGTEWSSRDFLMCLNTALEVMKVDGPLTVQVTAAFAFLRAILDAVASELVSIHTSNMSTATCHRYPATSVPTLAKWIRESPSSMRFRALKLYLLKVLHMKRGLSLVEISKLATRCGQFTELHDYTTILEWETMHAVTNPLGFDPFWSSSAAFEKSGEAIYALTSGNEGKAGGFIDRQTDELSQKQITAAIASMLYLPSASRKLTAGDRNASSWLLKPKSLSKWDKKWRELVDCFAQNDRATTKWSNLRLSPNMPVQDLLFRTLAAHILLVVTGLPRTSPLKGYISHDSEHLEAAYVLAAPNSSLAAFRRILLIAGNGKELAEYQCPCGFKYFVGECGKPMQTTKCPHCTRSIGGIRYAPTPGTIALSPQQIENGYIIDNVSRSDKYYSVRNLDPKCYRALRLILHFCLCIGLYRASSKELALRKLLGLQPQNSRPLEAELQDLIEEDFAKLDDLLACNRETTVKYVHFVVSFLSGMQNNVALGSPQARTQWETEFQGIFANDSFNSGAYKAAADYLERQKGNDRYSELVEERGPRLFVPALQDIIRITVAPSLSNFRTLYKQDTNMIDESPLIQVFFNHEKDLEDLKHFMNLIAFCKTAHEKYSFKISRPEAASMSMREALQESRGLKHQFQQFAYSWNAIREKVKGYECKQLNVPLMNEDARLALCLVEPRDHGLYIVALFQYLLTLQNAFLRDAADAVDANTRESTLRQVRVQACKTEDIVHYDQQWLENIVKEVAMANPHSGHGQQVLYDNVIIQEHVFRGLVKGKPQLADADWLEFPYKYESFHRHATILADVAAAIPQEALRPDTMQVVLREIESGGVGAGQFLEMMNLCLGFLRRTGGHQQKALGAYCELWLGKDSSELISKSSVFDKICLKHIVSLYEGLEDSASNNVEMLVSQKYRTPLTLSLIDEILTSVRTENAWKEETNVEKIPVSVFLNVLRRFMFRYLSADNVPKDIQLSLYLTNSLIAKWPADVVSEDIVENCFPSTVKLRHSFATYMLLSEIYKGGEWLKVGVSNGWITRPEN